MASDERSGLSRRRVLGLGAAAAGTIAAAGVVGTGAASASTSRAASASGWQGRAGSSFDLGWKFLRGDATGAQAVTFDDRSWRALDVPHDWGIEDLPYATSEDGAATDDPSTMAFQTTPPPAGTPTVIGPFDETNSAGGAKTGYTVGGIGWYRKHFTVTAAALKSGARTELRFDGVFHNYTVWLNGTELTTQAYAYTPVNLDLTPYLTAGDNVLALRIDNTGVDTRWYSGYGIFRHTWLTQTGPVRIPDYGVFVTTPTATESRSVVNVAIEAANYSSTATTVDARVTIFDESGRQVASGSTGATSVAAGDTGTLSTELVITRTLLWNPSSAHLYTARTELTEGSAVVDTVSTSFGIRSLVWDADNGLLINGTQIKVRGACLHSNYGPLGAIALGRSIEWQIETLQAAGFNAIRTAHNPPDPYVLDVCDRLGMLVWAEAFDAWSGYTATPDWVPDLQTFILRDRNHPSVIIWSTGNEVSDATMGLELHNVVKALDSTRPATQGATPFDAVTDPQYEYTDVSDVHYNFTDKLALRALYPGKPMTQSESWPTTVYSDWAFAQENSWFVGSWVWVGFDYMGEAGSGATITATSDANLPAFGTGPFPWFQDYQGDLDFIGQRKPQNYWRAVVHGLSPLELFVERPAPSGTEQYANYWSYYDELESWTWDVPAGQDMTVHAYTNGDSVTLRLNGKDIQTQAVTADDECVATFQVPYQTGELTAVASKGGRTIATKTLATTGSPAALRLTSDVSSLTTSRDDLAHVLVEVIDSHGQVVPDAVAGVSFTIRGAGQLAATGNGNPHNIDSFQQPHRYTWHGKALAIVRPASQPGDVTLTATADGLRSSTLRLNVRTEPSR